MKRFLLVLFAVLALGCAGTQPVKVVHDKPSDYLTCDLAEADERVCYSEEECQDVWDLVGGELAYRMKTEGTYVTIPFNVFEEHRSVSLIGNLWVEKRNDTELWLVMDTIVCDLEGIVVDEKRVERQFTGVVAP
jgi:hypothetical protein